MADTSSGILSSPSKTGWNRSNPFDLDDNIGYAAWRERKLANYPVSAEDLRVNLSRLAAPMPEEKSSLVERCRRSNMAIYATAPDESLTMGDSAMRAALTGFAAVFGLATIEDHRSAEDDGIVAIEASEAETKRAFIPYTKRALSWHTDGYYNAPGETIRAMLLHCVRPAREGGINALLDPDIVYIRLRDTSRDLIAAMMHPEAMAIPESVEGDGSVRPVSVGPVFFVEPSGGLTMRYTARARNVVWRDDADTKAAVALIDRLLAKEEEPLILKYKMKAGEGLLSNNVLHTRTAFENDDTAARLLYRVRYRQRISGT